ncbi:MAG TPA: hypothetical protein VFN71_14105 [Methylomirabilota bacterium]|nr:hypothetical protein [Methylomirabilota bacterium]
MACVNGALAASARLSSRLVDLIWPGTPLPDAAGALREALWNLWLVRGLNEYEFASFLAGALGTVPLLRFLEDLRARFPKFVLEAALTGVPYWLLATLMVPHLIVFVFHVFLGHWGPAELGAELVGVAVAWTGIPGAVLSQPAAHLGPGLAVGILNGLIARYVLGQTPRLPPLRAGLEI